MRDFDVAWINAGLSKEQIKVRKPIYGSSISEPKTFKGKAKLKNELKHKGVFMGNNNLKYCSVEDLENINRACVQKECCFIPTKKKNQIKYINWLNNNDKLNCKIQVKPYFKNWKICSIIKLALNENGYNLVTTENELIDEIKNIRKANKYKDEIIESDSEYESE